MEINGVGGNSGPTGLTKALKKADNTPFREVLQVRIAQTNSASPAAGPDARPVFLAQSERMLDLLDEFAQSLADPHKSLRDLAPLVRMMEGEVERLDPVPGAGMDQDLSRLVSEVSLLANVTLIKFHRGDFI